MKLQDVSVVGAGVLGCEVVDIFNAINQINFNAIGFMVDRPVALSFLLQSLLGGLQ
jgi:hypothetical protein